MSGSGDYGVVREEVLAETRERARMLASQGLAAREIEHRLGDELTAAERELLWGIVRQEVTAARREPDQEIESRQGPGLRPPSSGFAGPILPAARERWEAARRRTWRVLDGEMRRSTLAFVTVAVAAVAVGILVGWLLASGKHHQGATSPRVAAISKHRHGSASRSGTGAAASNRGRASPSSDKSTPVAPPVAPGSQVPQNTQGSQTRTEIAARLNDHGFQLMNRGRYGDAIPLLRRAVSASSSQSSGLTYAYALFNLGHSLRLAGRSDEAVPLLERRLQIDNQRATVSRELQAARRSAHSTGGSR